MKPYFVPPPVIGSIYKYPNVNKDKSMREYVTNYFRNKINRWLRESYYNELKQKFQVKNNQVIESSNNKTLNKNEDDLITEYIYQNYYDYRTTYKLLKSYAKKNKLKWWDLRKNKNYIKIFFFKYLKKKLTSFDK